MFDFATPVNPVAKTLRDAAGYIEEHGWCQNLAFTPDGRVCMLGAIHEAQGGYVGAWQDDAVIQAMDKYSREHLGCVNGYFPDWNDHMGRTKEEVIAALLGAADMVEREENSAISR